LQSFNGEQLFHDAYRTVIKDTPEEIRDQLSPDALDEYIAVFMTRNLFDKKSNLFAQKAIALISNQAEQNAPVKFENFIQSKMIDFLKEKKIHARQYAPAVEKDEKVKKPSAHMSNSYFSPSLSPRESVASSTHRGERYVLVPKK